MPDGVQAYFKVHFGRRGNSATAGQRGMLIAVLQRVQEKIGYLPEEAMKMIAERMSLSLSNVYGVASFYKHFHFKPRGKNVVKVCMSTACHVRGAKAVLRFERVP